MVAAAPDRLVGRERELAEIETFLSRAGPAALVLEGEPGIGKTTLWQYGVEAALAQGRLVLKARPAEAERELSFSALGDLVEPALDRLGALSSPRRRALQVALLLVSDEEAAPDARTLGLATRDLLRELAAAGPLLVAIDDVQWLDAPSRETLAYALRRFDSERFGLLTACRPGAEELPLGEVEHVGVGPLSLGALNELLRSRASPMARPTLLRVHETSGGNPFFALELARALEGRELRPGEPLPVPATLSALMTSRLEGLDAATREVLLFVAALARPTVEVVTEAAGGRAGPALETAVGARVIEVDDSRLRFTHPLLASAHYGSAPPHERARVHRRLAEVVTDVEERGRHLGAAATAPDEEVAAALEAASAAASGRGAPGPAAELSELAVSLTPAGEDDARTRRWFAAADSSFAAGDSQRACAILERLVDELAPGGLRSDALLRLAEYRDTYPASFELAERALAEAAGDASRSAAAEGLIALQSLVVRADLVLALEHHRRGLAFAERAGDPVELALRVAQTSHFESLTGRITPGLLERGVALEQAHGLLLLDYGPTFVLALRWMYRDRLADARDLLLRVGSAASERGAEPQRAYALLHLSELESRAGEYEAAAAYAAEGIELAREHGRTSTLAAMLYVGALAAAYLGRTQQARSLAEEGLEVARHRGAFMIQNASVLGFVELSVGDAAAAARRLRPLPGLAEQMGSGDPSVSRVLPNAIDALVQLGELDEARSLVDRLEEQGRRLDSPYALSTGARGRGLVLAAEGDLDGAELAFAQALAHHERMPGPFERARTLLSLGAARRRARRKSAARAALREAVEIFASLGAPLWAELARKEIARIGGRTAAAGGELSETEQRIAELVAQGRSNKEVAAALSLSPKTVEWNLSKVYAKLGVRSRAELAGRRP